MKFWEFALQIAMLGVVLWAGVIGISVHLVGRHLKKHYPRQWKEIGSPDLYTAQGSRNNRVLGWIYTNRYQRLNDPELDKWVPVLQKLPKRLGIAAGCLVLVAIAAAFASLR